MSEILKNYIKTYTKALGRTPYGREAAIKSFAFVRELLNMELDPEIEEALKAEGWQFHTIPSGPERKIYNQIIDPDQNKLPPASPKFHEAGIRMELALPRQSEIEEQLQFIEKYKQYGTASRYIRNGLVTSFTAALATAIVGEGAAIPVTVAIGSLVGIFIAAKKEEKGNVILEEQRQKTSLKLLNLELSQLESERNELPGVNNP